MFGCVGTDDLDDLSGLPRYLQIAAIVEREIREGVWQPGQAAPSRTVLMQRFGVAGETARRAQALLTSRGYLVTVPGVGMIVTPRGRWPGETPDQ
jgi:DNA-binding GntR family transcriptional regulator